VTTRCALTVIALSSLSLGVARAEPSAAQPTPATDGTACVQSYEQGQEQRQSGKLLEARVQLEKCAQDACPEFIRNDCLTWDNELRAEIPSVVFAARSAERDLSDVRVSSGKRLLTAHIDGEAIELNPGEYDFEFQPSGMAAVTQHVLISRGERNRLLRAEFGPIANDPARVSGTSLPLQAQRSWDLPVILGGVGVLGLAGFAGFGALGRSAESQLQTTCSPHCTEHQIASVRAKYTIADVSLLVGVGSIGLASYFMLRESPAPRTARRIPFDVRANARNLSFTYEGAF